MYKGHESCVMLKAYESFFFFFFFEIWSWVDMCIFSLLPWLCLAVSNSLLAWKLRLSLREAKLSLGSSQADRINDRKKESHVNIDHFDRCVYCLPRSYFSHVVLPHTHLHILDEWNSRYTGIVTSCLLHSSDKLYIVVCQQLYQFLRLLPDRVKVQERGQTNTEVYVS